MTTTHSRAGGWSRRPHCCSEQGRDAERQGARAADAETHDLLRKRVRGGPRGPGGEKHSCPGVCARTGQMPATCYDLVFYGK